MKKQRQIIHITISLQKPSALNRSTKQHAVQNKVTPHDLSHEQIETGSSNTAGIANDFHRDFKKNEKKKLCKCSHQCFIATLLLLFMLVLIVTITLLVHFIKPKKNVSPNSAPVLRWNTTGITIVGGLGASQNQLNTPLDTIIDYANNLYVADYLNFRIQKFLFGNPTGQTVAGNGTLGCSQYQLCGASRIILDSNLNLYVSNTYCNRVEVWRSGLGYGTVVTGNDSQQLNVTYGIAIHRITNTLYVADYNNHRIMSYSSGSSSGTVELGGTGLGYSNTKLCYPVGLYLDLVSNSLLIANAGANNIVRLVLGSSNWTLVAGDLNASPGATSNLLTQPTDITLDPMGNLYVADRNNHRIQFFYSGQLNGTTIAGIAGVSNSTSTTLNMPWSIKLDNQLNLYVADSNNNRIQKFLRY